MQTILILNGPNLNLLGRREPEIYGATSLAEIGENCAALAGELGLAVDFRQSNHEGELVDWIQQASGVNPGLIINPGAYSHTSIAILDALNFYAGKVMEVHLSNIHRRETFRHHSHVSARADGIIVGCGPEGYLLALRRLATEVN